MDAVMALKLRGPVKAVLFVLARRVSDKTGRCWPSLNRLAEDSGFSRRLVTNAIAELQAVGVLNVIRYKRKVSDYFLNFEALRVARGASQSSTRCARNPSLNLAKKSPSQKSTEYQFPKCVSCGRWPTIDGDAKLCLKCWRTENPKRRITG